MPENRNLTPDGIIRILERCCREDGGEFCHECPYNVDSYEQGCGALLADSVALLRRVYPREGQA